MPAIHFPFYPFNGSKQSRSIAKPIARQRKNSHIKGAAVASSRLFKIRQLNSNCSCIPESH